MRYAIRVQNHFFAGMFDDAPEPQGWVYDGPDRLEFETAEAAVAYLRDPANKFMETAETGVYQRSDWQPMLFGEYRMPTYEVVPADIELKQDTF
jgi:hypothetical protein